MAQPVSLRGVRNAFEIAVGSAANLYAAVDPFVARTYDGIATNPLHPSQARRIVALAFLALVAAWEEFVEASFVRYLAGGHSTLRRRPQLKFGPASRLDDAYAVIAGRPNFDPVRHHLNWGVEDTINRALIFFGSGDPFQRPLTVRKQALQDAAIIRNRVAHSSQKARAAFSVVARRLRGGKLPRAYSVGDLLLERVAPAWAENYEKETLFVAYLYVFVTAADEVAGLPSADRTPPQRDAV
ncbi:MAG TPA: hypothetical protein VE974_22615 [Thermoanaerobaculia bacterium]|nr:hypothetical protein [Thermoanaerobaculia bacterium]